MGKLLFLKRWLFIFILIAPSFVIQAHGENTKKGQQAFTYMAQDLNAMSFESLTQIADLLNSKYGDVAELLVRKPGQPFDAEVIRHYGRIECLESIDMLLTVIFSELKRIEKDPKDTEAFVLAVETAARIITSRPGSQLEDLRELIKDASGRLSKSPAVGKIVGQLEKLYELGNSRDQILPSIELLIQKRQNDSRSGSDHLERVRRLLEEQIIGQPEVVSSFSDLEWKNALYGKSRELPDVVYLMGMPGTGKDTAAEAFADALHGVKGAFKTHLFSLPVLKTSADTWKVFGSNTGFVGSDNFPPFLAFLIQHAGGKYQISRLKDQLGRTTYRVINNPEYKGETLPGYYGPETAVVFVNEFHNWSRQLKDDVIKRAIEKGTFSINNPNGGLSEISVPVHFILATNEGIGLTTSREANGERNGKPLSYEQVLAKWEKVHGNKGSLRNAIMATNGARNNSATDHGPGISEELLSRIPEQNILLMRPLSPTDLKKIAQIKLKQMAERLAVKSHLLGQVNFKWQDSVVSFIQEYDYVPEDNARPVVNRIESIVEKTLIDALREKKIEPNQGQTEIMLDVKTNEDRTRSLVIDLKENNDRTYQVVQIIRSTEKDRPKPTISDDRIDQLSRIEEELKSSVFGVDPILERLTRQTMSIENETHASATRRANIIMLTGLSSTGKTETAKQLSAKLSGSDDELLTFDFSQIQTLDAFKKEILGLTDSLNNPIPSRFMKAYDRANGKLIVALDELANVRDRDLLKALYDFFREPVVSTFSDNKPRAMGGVTLIVTGNAGQELFNRVPSDLPVDVQMRAWAEIYQHVSNDPALQRAVLEKYFPEPLIARVGMPNIFFVPPHTFRSLRQLAQLKLEQALARIQVTENRRGWQILFPNAEEYKSFIDTVIEEGFNLRSQGASIDSFVLDDFERPINAILVQNKVPSGTKVILKLREKTPNDNEETPGYVIYDLYVDGLAKPLEYKIRRPYVARQIEENKTEQIVTAYHEAGHNLVRMVLFRDVYEGNEVTVIPGVRQIHGEWVYFLGVASAEQVKSSWTSHEWAVRQIAILAAGETAERLVSRGETHSTGKVNDMERATRLARDTIIRYGLIESWGPQSIPTGMSVEAYIASLSEPKKLALEKEVSKLLREGREMAQTVIEANFDDAFVPLANQLVEEGSLNKEALKAFYENRKLVYLEDVGFVNKMKQRLRTKMRKWSNPRTDLVHVELDGSLPAPNGIADIQAIIAADKQAQFESVALPARLPVGVNDAYQGAHKASPVRKAECSALLEKAG